MIKCIGTDVLITGTVPLYDWAEIQIMVTDASGLRFYSTQLGESAEGKAVTMCNGDTARIIINRKYLTHPIIAHEVVHAANWILCVSGVKVSQHNDESLAYLVDGITKWCNRELCKAKIKIK